MTDRDDFDDLKAAMAAATPAPDAARRAATLAQASALYNRTYASAPQSFPRRIFRLPRFGGIVAGLATGATAMVALFVAISPDQPMSPAPMSTTTEAPLAAPEIAEADVMAMEEAAPMIASDSPRPAVEGLPDTADFSAATASRGLVPADPWSAIAALLEQGLLPAPGTLDQQALLNAPAETVPARPEAIYPVPWDTQLALRDSGRPDDRQRFQIVPLDGRVVAIPDDRMNFVIAAAGFAARLNAGQDINGWGSSDALALAQTSDVTPDDLRIVALMQMANGIAGN